VQRVHILWIYFARQFCVLVFVNLVFHFAVIC